MDSGAGTWPADGMIVISGTARVRPEAREEAIAAAREMARLSTSEHGCRAYEFSTVLDDPNTFRLFEQWDDEAALIAHFGTPHFAAFSGRLGAFLAAPPSFTRYDVAGAGPLSRPEPPPATTPEGERLGDVANRLLFENALVRVWQMKLAPGEGSDLHRHDHPYLLCVVDGESVDADWPGREPYTIPVAPGDVLFVPPGTTERAVNRSSKAFHEILIELKSPTTAPLELQTFTAKPLPG
jgi:quinol monooxygenase YgiN/quercetin dioxygenase-like cupin family protein